jgi:hypothetical protein
MCSDSVCLLRRPGTIDCSSERACSCSTSGVSIRQSSRGVETSGRRFVDLCPISRRAGVPSEFLQRRPDLRSAARLLPQRIDGCMQRLRICIRDHSDAGAVSSADRFGDLCDDWVLRWRPYRWPSFDGVFGVLKRIGRGRTIRANSYLRPANADGLR